MKSEKQRLYERIMNETSKIVKKAITEATETKTDDLENRLKTAVEENPFKTQKLASICAECAEGVADDIDTLRLVAKEKDPEKQKNMLKNVIAHLNVYNKYLNKGAVMGASKK